MAGPNSVLAPDQVTRSVWVVVDPRDAVTGARATVPLRVGLRNVAAEPVLTLSGVYCFTDLNLSPGKYVVEVQPLREAVTSYFAAEAEFLLQVPPVPGKPLDRNRVTVDLFPRPAYLFGEPTSLARGRLRKASDGGAVERADVTLILNGTDEGRRGRTDERGDFVVFFPPEPPDEAPPDPPVPGPKTLTFRLAFTVPARPPHVTADQHVDEGGSVSLGEITFPTL
jgi:hypothetical protein